MSVGEMYACLHAKEFSAQAMMRLRPELRGKAVVVVEGTPPSESACSCNLRARTMGVVRGMTRVELDTFTALSVVQRSRVEEVSARKIMLECAGGFSPRIEDCSDDQVFLSVIDIAGTEKLFGSSEKLARALLQRIAALGISACVAVSKNFHAAMSYARGPVCRVGILKDGEEAAVLSQLPLSVLNVSSVQAETFALWGIRNLGALAALPERELIARMGQDGRRLRELAQGRHTHHFVPIEEEFQLEERMELDTPVEQLDSLLFVLGVLLEQLIVRATARVLALASVTITLTLEGNTTHTRSVRPTLATNDRQLWIKLLHLDLEAHPPLAAIVGVRLAAEPGRIGKIQLGLFSTQLPEPALLDVTLARIRAIVGEDCVGRPVLEDTHRLDRFKMEAFRVPTGPASKRGTGHAPTAMRSLRPPEMVEVKMNGRQPGSLVFRESRYRVESLHGPWLAVGDWWNAEAWTVEQWDLIARSADGETLCCCLARDLMQQRWLVVTLYD